MTTFQKISVLFLLMCFMFFGQQAQAYTWTDAGNKIDEATSKKTDAETAAAIYYDAAQLNYQNALAIHMYISDQTTHTTERDAFLTDLEYYMSSINTELGFFTTTVAGNAVTADGLYAEAQTAFSTQAGDPNDCYDDAFYAIVNYNLVIYDSETLHSGAASTYSSIDSIITSAYSLWPQ